MEKGYENLTDLQKLYNQVLYPQVRVKTDKFGGSGTIVYSKCSANKKSWSSYILTCRHVIDEAVQVVVKWSPPPIGHDIKQEMRKLVTVEFFDYENVLHGHRPINSSVDAEIMAYDMEHDMALLKLRTLKSCPAVANILPLDLKETIQLGSPVVAVGAALLHDPILTFGQITHMGDEIDYKDYWMSNANIAFGNSGGAVFYQHDGTYYFIGIPSRVDVVGWGSPVTHLGYFSPINRVYEFLKEQMFDFIIDPSQTELGCEERRKAKEEEEKRKLSFLSPTAPTAQLK